VFTIYEREFPLGPTLAVALDDQEIDPRVGCTPPSASGSSDKPTGMSSLHSLKG